MFFILDKLSDILGNHSYVTDLVIRNIAITKENFRKICESFCNITSLSIIDCPFIEFTEDITKLNLKEISMTNCGFEDADLEYFNSLDLEILNFIDINDLDLSRVTAVNKVKNLSLIYDKLAYCDDILKDISAEYLDVRGTKVDIEYLVDNQTVKKLVTTSTDVNVLAALKRKGIELKIEQE